MSTIDVWPRPHIERPGHSRRHSRYRYRTAAAGAEAAQLGWLFARAKGYMAPTFTAAELELMNMTGDRPTVSTWWAGRAGAAGVVETLKLRHRAVPARPHTVTSDGYPKGIKRERSVGEINVQFCGCPRNCKRQIFVISPLGSRLREGDGRWRPVSQETCRQPWSRASTPVGVSWR